MGLDVKPTLANIKSEHIEDKGKDYLEDVIHVELPPKADPEVHELTYFEGSPITRSQFGATLKRAVEFAGAAGSYPTAANQGIPDWKIQEMGRWCSSTFKSYIQFPL